MAVIDLLSEVAGTVWKIPVQAGQSLTEEELLLYVESMKMEIPVAVPEDCRVLEILVTEGEVIAQGAVLARLQVE